jgi:hypothetical protein
MPRTSVLSLFLIFVASAVQAQPLSFPVLPGARFSGDLFQETARWAAPPRAFYREDAGLALFRSLSVRVPASKKMSMSGFALFAAKFMGREDVGAWGGIRLRFKVILE